MTAYVILQGPPAEARRGRREDPRRREGGDGGRLRRAGRVDAQHRQGGRHPHREGRPRGHHDPLREQHRAAAGPLGRDGSEEAFVKKMNDAAKDLGMTEHDVHRPLGPEGDHRLHRRGPGEARQRAGADAGAGGHHQAAHLGGPVRQEVGQLQPPRAVQQRHRHQDRLHHQGRRQPAVRRHPGGRRRERHRRRRGPRPAQAADHRHGQRGQQGGDDRRPGGADLARRS